jgi:hypothetical protein
MEDEEGSDDLIVFLKASEEAEFSVQPRKFQWIKTGLPVLTSFATVFDGTLNEWVLELRGTGFGNS